MFEIRSEYGTKVSYTPRTYDMACRVAHFMRKRACYEFMVCENNRAVSEVFDFDVRKDHYAMTVARRLV